MNLSRTFSIAILALFPITAACSGRSESEGRSDAPVVASTATPPAAPAPPAVPPDGCPAPGAPGVHYISADPAKLCTTILFDCDRAKGETPFSNECGCGCVDKGYASPAPTPPPPPDAGAKRYVAYGKTCLVILFSCAPGETYFGDAVGCGCEPL